MPCQDDYREEREAQERKAWADIRAHNDRLASLLCESCRYMINKGIELPPNTKVWYDQHKPFDIKNGRL